MIDLIVIGGGPAGLFCAQRVAAAGLQVLVLEKNTRAGKKLLVAGSGKCNITNTGSIDHFLTSYGKKGRFVAPSLRSFFNTDLISFFESQGLPLIELHAGKIFPQTLRSSDVLKTLLSACEKSGVSFYYNSPVSEIIQENENENSYFSIVANSKQYFSKYVLVSCGGSSWPVTGSTGDGYVLSQGLGHSIVEPRPSLTPVIPAHYDCASCAGFSIQGTCISLWREGKKIGERQGDVLFTHVGLSGPGILDFSRDFKSADEISIQLLPFINGTSTDNSVSTTSDADSQLLALCSFSPKKTVKNILSSFGLSESLVLVLLQRVGLDTSLVASLLDRKSRKALSLLLEDFRFTINRLGGFDEAMATTGGVDTTEVQGKTMESRLVSGLHFAGEVLDVDGDTGGYNLQFAFSSAALAADHIIKKAMPSSL